MYVEEGKSCKNLFWIGAEAGYNPVHCTMGGYISARWQVLSIQVQCANIISVEEAIRERACSWSDLQIAGWAGQPI